LAAFSQGHLLHGAAVGPWSELQKEKACQELPPPFTWELAMYSGPHSGSSLQLSFYLTDPDPDVLTSFPGLTLDLTHQ